MQNPTQRVKRPVRDAFEKDLMRFMISSLLIELEKHLGEGEASNDEAKKNAESDTSDAKSSDKKDTEDEMSDETEDLRKSSLNTYIRDIRDIPALANEDAICQRACDAVFAYYDTSAHAETAEQKDSSQQKTDTQSGTSSQPSLSLTTTISSPNRTTIHLTERPYISNQALVQTVLEPEVYIFTRTEVLFKLRTIYQQVLREYAQYTSTVYVSNIGELPSQNLNTEGIKHNTHYKVKSHTITVIQNPNEFWNIDANIHSDGGDAILGKELQFRHIRNDGHVSHLKLLNGVKHIYSKQLPNMPTHYIARLVFDRTHRSMLAIKDGAVVGGITYKPFEPQGFAEIAFVAVDASLQVKQCGTRLMNHLKHHFKKEGKIWRFLTFADNSAVGFFKKMGFSKDITIPNWRYSSYIKYYTDVSLMECVLRPGIPYLKTKEWVTKQEEVVEEHIKVQEERRKKNPETYTVQSKPSRSHHGLYFNSKGNLYNKYKGSRIKRIEDVPGLKNARGLLPVATEEELTTMRDKLKPVWRAVHDHKDASIFHFLDRNMDDYFQIIKTPVDLALIESRLDKLYYRHVEMFVADFRRLFDNCRLYNQQSKVFFNMANTVDRFFREKMLEKGFSVGGMNPVPKDK